jgi:flagellar motor switch protein FliM
MTSDVYDFRSPSPLPGELSRRLDHWVAEAVRRAPKIWASVLTVPATLRGNGHKLITAEDYPDYLPAEALAFPVVLGSPDKLSLLVLPRPLMLVLLDGALGETVTTLPADRELTAVEESLAEHLIRVLVLDLFRAAWIGTQPLALEVKPREADPRSLRLFRPDEAVLLCTFSVTGTFGELEWCWLLPRSGWLEDGNTAPPQPAAQPPLETLARLMPVELLVLLGTAEVTLTQVERLQTGDLILLDQSVSDPLRALVSGADKFRVVPGAVGSRQAIRVQSVIAS